jgi:hypothetical protein
MTGQPGGTASRQWREFTRQLWGQWGPGVRCWFCGHRITPGRGELEHRVSPSLRPDLAWAVFWRGEPFLVPTHGGGSRRCPEPGCGLNCNAIAGGNASPRDALGRSAKWTPEFLERKQEERRCYRAREGVTSVVGQRKTRARAQDRPRVPEPAARPAVDIGTGREW